MKIDFLCTDTKLKQAVNAFIEDWHSEDDTIYSETSGSTGTPKRIAIKKEHMINSARMTGEFLGLKENDKALLCLSPSTIAGKMMIIRSLIIGMDLTIIDVKSDPLKNLQGSFDFCAMIPIQIKSSINTLSTKRCQIRKIIVGGGSVSPALRNEIQGLSSEVYQTFGMTESISHIAMRDLKSKEGSYRLLPNISIASVDGRLQISAPKLGIDKLLTNDVVEITESSSFFWKGRSDFVINSGGIKIHPEQIESKLCTLLPATPFFSTGIRDEKYGQRHVLCIEGADDVPLDKSSFKELLGPHQSPKEIYFFEKFTYTNSGKINRLRTLNSISNAKRKIL